MDGDMRSTAWFQIFLERSLQSVVSDPFLTGPDRGRTFESGSWRTGRSGWAEDMEGNLFQGWEQHVWKVTGQKERGVALGCGLAMWCGKERRAPVLGL
jgi:hypothetical protein